MEATGSDTKDLNDLCSICLQSFRSPVGRPESCTHVFCLSCIEEAARLKDECPQCQLRFRNIQVSERIGSDISNTGIELVGVGVTTNGWQKRTNNSHNPGHQELTRPKCIAQAIMGIQAGKREIRD
ncbi:hypothetical protein ACTXT7_000276 [Hymenolepis weldensis]